MAPPRSCAAQGTILFQEDMICTSTTPRVEYDASILRLPQISKLPNCEPLLVAHGDGATPATGSKPAQTWSSRRHRLPKIIGVSHPSSPPAISEALVHLVSPHRAADSIHGHARRKPRGTTSNGHRVVSSSKQGPRSRTPLPMMTKTLLEVVHAKEIAGGAAISRGVHDQQLLTLDAQRNEMAQHRHKVLRRAMERQRAQTRHKRQRRQQERSLSPEVAGERQVFSANPGDSESDLESSRDERSRFNSNHSRFNGIQDGNAVLSKDSDTEEPVMCENVAMAKRVTAKKLKLIKHARSRNDRMTTLSHARKMMKHEQKADQMFEVRKREFEALPEDEKELLTSAFAMVRSMMAPSDDSGYSPSRRSLIGALAHPGRKSLIEPFHLMDCLNCIGLTGADDHERKEIKMICQEVASRGEPDFHLFCFELVPYVRRRLMESRTEQLAIEFATYDEDCDGYLDSDECLAFVNRLCHDMDSEGYEEVRNEFLALFDRLQLQDEHRGTVDFDGFQMLVALAREKHERVRCDRIKQFREECHLSNELLFEFTDEILLLHEVFEEQEPNLLRIGGLRASQATAALLDCGTMPLDSTQRYDVLQLVQDAAGDSAQSVIPFARFLVLIREVRKLCRDVKHVDLLKRFNSYDKDRSGTLSFAEASIMFEELGLTPQCREDQEAMKQLLLKVDVNHSGDLDFREFQDLVQRVGEKLQSGKRRRENMAAKDLGFSQKEVAELRESFLNLDEKGEECLSIQECRKTLTLLRKEMSAHDLQELFAQIDLDGDGLIDFHGFLHFMKMIQRKAPSGNRRRGSYIGS